MIPDPDGRYYDPDTKTEWLIWDQDITEAPDWPEVERRLMDWYGIARDDDAGV